MKTSHIVSHMISEILTLIIVARREGKRAIYLRMIQGNVMDILEGIRKGLGDSFFADVVPSEDGEFDVVVTWMG